MKTAVFYGSTMGDTARIADILGEKLNAEVYSVADGISKLESYELIVMGSSTWGWGELQDDWNEAVGNISNFNLSGKKVAVFGTGDQMAYSDTFCDALGILADAAKDAGAEVVGTVSREGYDFNDSRALIGDNLVGLAIDVNNQDDQTESRINSWVDQIKSVG